MTQWITDHPWLTFIGWCWAWLCISDVLPKRIHLRSGK